MHNEHELPDLANLSFDVPHNQSLPASNAHRIAAIEPTLEFQSPSARSRIVGDVLNLETGPQKARAILQLARNLGYLSKAERSSLNDEAINIVEGPTSQSPQQHLAIEFLTRAGQNDYLGPKQKERITQLRKKGGEIGQAFDSIEEATSLLNRMKRVENQPLIPSSLIDDAIDFFGRNEGSNSFTRRIVSSVIAQAQVTEQLRPDHHAKLDSIRAEDTERRQMLDLSIEHATARLLVRRTERKRGQDLKSTVDDVIQMFRQSNDRNVIHHAAQAIAQARLHGDLQSSHRLSLSEISDSDPDRRNILRDNMSILEPGGLRDRLQQIPLQGTISEREMQDLGSLAEDARTSLKRAERSRQTRGR